MGKSSVRSGMPTYSRSEIEKALYAFGFEYVRSRGKGDHDRFEHKDLPFFNLEIQAKREIDANLYRDVVAQLALLTLITEHSLEDLKSKKLTKLRTSVETLLRSKGYYRYLLVELKTKKDEYGRAYDNQEQLDKFIEELRKQYKKSKKSEGGDGEHDDFE